MQVERLLLALGATRTALSRDSARGIELGTSCRPRAVRRLRRKVPRTFGARLRPDSGTARPQSRSRAIAVSPRNMPTRPLQPSVVIESRPRSCQAGGRRLTRPARWVRAPGPHSDRLARGDGLTADHLAEVSSRCAAPARVRSVQDDSTNQPMLAARLANETGGLGAQECRARGRENGADGSRGRGRRSRARRIHAGAELDPQGHPLTERDGRVVYRRVINPERAPPDKTIFERSRPAAVREVARAFNAEGRKTMRGKDWTTRRVRETVLLSLLRRWITVYGERNRGEHEPLIDSERWERICRRSTSSRCGRRPAAPRRPAPR